MTSETKLPELPEAWSADINTSTGTIEYYFTAEQMDAHYLKGYNDARAAVEQAKPEGDRPCTCHSSDNPPTPCARKYALTDCIAARLSEAPPAAVVESMEYDKMDAIIEERQQKPADSAGVTEALYHELLYAVARKHPGESRHETALRYIRQAEAQANAPSEALSAARGK